MSVFGRKNIINVVFVVLCCVCVVSAQEMDCYGAGSIAGAVLGTFFVTLILLTGGYFAYKWFWKNRREKHLVLETDPEHGDKYAFDNPCFKDGTPGGLTPIAKALDKSGTRLLDTGKKWSQWSPLGALVSTKNEKKRTLDDTHLEASEVKTVSLRGHDFTGLGFNICGNMRDGIYIKDVLHRGPASESGKLNPGDRINSVRISFENMVYEDALTILCYASPYEVEVEAKTVPKGQNPPGSGGQGAQPKHPLFRSSSSSDLVKIGKSARQRLFLNGETIDSSLDYTKLTYSSNNTTLERGRKSPKTDVNSLTKPERTKKSQNNANSKGLTPEQLKTQLEQNLSQAQKMPTTPTKVEAEKQTTEADAAGKNKFQHQKFGVRVLPMESKEQPSVNSRSPKSAELSQNDNNINQERQANGLPEGVDEVDKTKLLNGDVAKDEAPPIKKREKTKTTIEPETFERQNSLNGSGIKRDKAGIPQEIPEHMLQAANAARKNRKSQEIIETPEIEPEVKTPKKQKGKAPAPPPVLPNQQEETPVPVKLNFSDNLDEISTLQEEEKETKKPVEETPEEPLVLPPAEPENEANKEYCSDSDMETDNQSSVNTIELNSSDITIHHAEQAAQNSEIKGRKTASTGDLSKIQKEKKPSSGTLERAQSLDITDSGIPTLNKKRKATKGDLDSKLSSDESLYENPKEPRLSLALDGLDTFQRNRLKKSSEWGNLEDVILNLDKVENNEDSGDEGKQEFVETTPIKFDFGSKEEVPFLGIKEETKNTIWPALDDLSSLKDVDDSNLPDDVINTEKIVIKPQIVDKKDKVVNNVSVQNVLWPETNKTEETTEKHFSLKDTFQEKLNSKLSEATTTTTTMPTTTVTNGDGIAYHPGKSSQNFIFAEKYASNNDCYEFPKYDTNISDDIKVSRHSLGSLERPKSDVLKSVNKLKMQNLIASDQGGVSNITVTEAQKEEEPSELYTTASDLTLTLQDEKPESDQYEIKNITITEYSEGPSSLTIDTSSDGPDSIKSNTLTFITEIQVTTPPDETKQPEESLRKLPEMKFTTSSYESPKTPEKRISQIELLRSNFEKSPSKSSKTEISPSKSRIPVATKIDFKMSPERKDDDGDIVEIISTNVHHSTPLVTKLPNLNTNTNTNIKVPNSRNVTVTSIRSSSKIPSGATSGNKPPVPARPDTTDTHGHVHERNGTESSFKQWVFNPNENSVTNIVVNNNKDNHK